VSGLAVKRSTGVPEAMLARIARLREELAAAGLDDLLADFESGDGEPRHRYAIDAPQLAAILREVRQGKQFADFLLVALHAHESLTNPDPGRADWTPPLPAACVAEFGRLAIDAGADAVVVTGIHHLGPIELHAGRPILTGLGNFFWSDIQTPLSADIRADAADALRQAFARPERATEADLTLLMNMPTFAHEECFLSVAAQMVFEHGALHRLVLHPLDLGYGDPLALSGLPRLASSAQGERIFDRLSVISAAHGTEIVVRRDDARDTVVGEVAV
jgi:poly-gamma-glutamate synthesis protein (capsule biosynthesis protein)